jgi:hypothetical protein
MNPVESLQAVYDALKKQQDELAKSAEEISRYMATIHESMEDVQQAIQKLGCLSIRLPSFDNYSAPLADVLRSMEETPNLGITAAIERVLKANPNIPLPPTSVRNILRKANFELVGDNPMASIHQILKRLIARQGSPFVSVEYQGQTLYKYDPKRDWMRTLKGVNLPPGSLEEAGRAAKSAAPPVPRASSAPPVPSDWALLTNPEKEK